MSYVLFDEENDTSPTHKILFVWVMEIQITCIDYEQVAFIRK